MPLLTRFVHRCSSSARRAIERAGREALALRADRSGNVAIIFAIAAIPIFGAVAVAVDYSRANSAPALPQQRLKEPAYSSVIFLSPLGGRG